MGGPVHPGRSAQETKTVEQKPPIDPHDVIIDVSYLKARGWVALTNGYIDNQPLSPDAELLREMKAISRRREREVPNSRREPSDD